MYILFGIFLHRLHFGIYLPFSYGLIIFLTKFPFAQFITEHIHLTHRGTTVKHWNTTEIIEKRWQITRFNVRGRFVGPRIETIKRGIIVSASKFMSSMQMSNKEINSWRLCDRKINFEQCHRWKLSAATFRDRDGSINMRKKWACLHYCRRTVIYLGLSFWNFENRNRAVLNVRFVSVHNRRFIVMRGISICWRIGGSNALCIMGTI